MEANKQPIPIVPAIIFVHDIPGDIKIASDVSTTQDSKVKTLDLQSNLHLELFFYFKKPLVYMYFLIKFNVNFM